jgi:hypothetical protein
MRSSPKLDVAPTTNSDHVRLHWEPIQRILNQYSSSLHVIFTQMCASVLSLFPGCILIDFPFVHLLILNVYCFTGHIHIFSKKFSLSYGIAFKPLHSLLLIHHLIPQFCLIVCSSQTLLYQLLKRFIVRPEKITEWCPIISHLFAISCNFVN